MKVKDLIASLQVSDHGEQIRPGATVRLATCEAGRAEILSVYPSKRGNILWIDIEVKPEPVCVCGHERQEHAIEPDDRRTAGDTCCLHIPDCPCFHFRKVK